MGALNENSTSILTIKYRLTEQEIIVGTDVWYHLVLVENNDNEFSIYIDGVKRQLSHSRKISLVSFKGELFVHSGVCIDELLLSKTNVSDDQIIELYNSYFSGAY